jgi:hypothetical protein
LKLLSRGSTNDNIIVEKHLFYIGVKFGLLQNDNDKKVHKSIEEVIPGFKVIADEA